jgi:hypothetical protein
MSDDIELPDGPLRFVSRIAYERLEAELAERTRERDKARDDAARTRRLLDRYRRPMADGGMTVREKAQTWKQERIERQEAEAQVRLLKEALERADQDMRKHDYLEAHRAIKGALAAVPVRGGVSGSGDRP